MSERGHRHRAGRAGFSRRELLGTMAASGGVLLAGCSGGDSSGDGSTDDGGDGSNPDGQTYHYLSRMDPKNMNWLNPPISVRLLLYPPGQTMRPDGEVVSHTVDSLDIGPTETTLRIREGATWSNGEPMLAEDLGKFLELNRVLGPDPEKVRSGETVPDDWRFAFTDFEWDGRELLLRSPADLLEKLASPSDVWSYLNREVGVRSRFYYDDVWSDFQDNYDDPWESEETHKKAHDEIQATLYNHLLINGGLRDSENVVSSGPWKLDSVGANKVSMRPHDGHPTMSDGANFPKLVVRPLSNIQKAAASLKTGNGDAFQPRIGPTSRFFPPSVAAEIPDDIRRFDAKTTAGQGLIFNHAELELLGDRRVRAAMMYAIDQSQAAENAHTFGERPVDVPGLDPVDESRYSDDVVSGLLSYEKDTEKAAQLLREAGFSKSGDTWTGPDGGDFEVPILSVQQATIDRPAPLMTQSIESQLQSFGIQAEMIPLEQSSAGEKFRNGNFVGAIDSWPAVLGNGRPYNRAAVRYASAVGFKFNMRPQLRFFEDSLPGIVEGSDGISWATPDDPAKSGITAVDPEPLKQLTVEAPPVGQPEGSLREYPVAYLAAKAVTGWTWGDQETKQQEALEKLLWVYNYDLPHFEITRTVPQIYHDVSRWKVPDPEDDIWRYSGPGGYPSGINGALLHGKIEAK